MDAVCRRRGRTCVEALATMRSAESENELDWLLSMGLMWATDLKTGLKGAELVCAVGGTRCILYAVCGVVFLRSYMNESCVC